MNYIKALSNYLSSRLNDLGVAPIQSPLGSAMFLLPNAEIITNKSRPWHHVVNCNGACCNLTIRVKDNIVAYDAFHELVADIAADIARAQKTLTQSLARLSKTHTLIALECVSCNFRYPGTNIIQGDLTINAFIDEK